MEPAQPATAQPTRHQYVTRTDEGVVTEKLAGDRLVTFLYGRGRERPGTLLRIVTSARVSSLLALINFDLPFANRLLGRHALLRSLDIDLTESVEPPEFFSTPRRIFERRIRYWDCRPMPEDRRAVVSPADARVLVGSFRNGSPLRIKDKFFEFEELLGRNKRAWLGAFAEGDFAIFRLTPDRYHYNHVPVSGDIVDFYEIPGRYHACNPGAVVQVVKPYSKNRRVVTIINSDVPGGSGVGLVAMIEVVALMIGDVVQCYSGHGYDYPQPVWPGLRVQRGQPKSLYRPGSSTDVLIFQTNRIRFADDLVRNQARSGVHSRFSLGFGSPLVETDVQVRSLIGWRIEEDQ